MHQCGTIASHKIQHNGVSVSNRHPVPLHLSQISSYITEIPE